MKIVDFDKLSVLNLHYCQYTLDYFLDCMQELGIKNVELLGGHQGLWLDPKEYQDPEAVRKNYRNTVLKCPVFTPQNCRFSYQFGGKEPELKKTFGFCKWDTSGAALGAEKDKQIRIGLLG